MTAPIATQSQSKILTYLRRKAEKDAADLLKRFDQMFSDFEDREDADTLGEEAATGLLDGLVGRICSGAAGHLTIPPLNIGRADAAKDAGAGLAEVSELLDANSCGPCKDHDGKQVEIGSDEYYQHMLPYQDCDGEDNCRGIYVYDFSSDSEDEANQEEA